MSLYRILLKLFPASFRAEYGEEMAAIFARERAKASGPHHLIYLWASTLPQTVTSAAAVHWDMLKQDLAYAVRTLGRSPGFAATAIVVLALGVGANTAAFSVTDFVLIRPLPFTHSDRLVRLWEQLSGYSEMELSPANYRDWKAAATSFDSMGAFFTVSMNLTGQGEPERIEGSSVTHDLFGTLGVPVMLGRGFTADDDREGAPDAILLSHRFWNTMFAADRSIVGRTINLDGRSYTVIGVMPPDFFFPARDDEFWTPIRFRPDDFEDRNNNYLGVVARLKPGLGIAQARAEMDVVTARLARQYPTENAHHGASIKTLRDEMPRQSRLLLIALMGAAICVLLIACANLANLLLARALVRQRELAVRAAIGAGRDRLVRQLITESLVLALAGGSLGILVAAAAVPLFTKLVPNSLPIAATPSIDLRVMAFALTLSLLTGIAFGLAPAFGILKDKGLAGLREGARSGGGGKERLRGALVIAEVMASVVLLVSAGLLMRALWRVQDTDPGFRGQDALTVRTWLPWPKYQNSAPRTEFYDQVLTGVRAIPGVRNAAYISFLPMVMGGGIWPVSVDRLQPLDRSEANSASMRFITREFFASLDIPILSGRDVRDSDTGDAPLVAVVSRSFAERYWPGQNALGHHFQIAFRDRTIVGVVGDIRVRGLERTSEPQVYLPQAQQPDQSFIFYTPKDLVVQSSAPNAALIAAIHEIVHKADPEQPISDIRTMSDIVAAGTASRSAQVKVLAAFACLAFLLAAVGIHGLMAFSVSQRAAEIGVRVALGARPGDVLRMVLRQGLWLLGLGMVPGIAISYMAGRAMAALLAGIKPADSATFSAAITLCLLMTMLGVMIPALRAVRLDPITALRAEQ